MREVALASGGILLSESQALVYRLSIMQGTVDNKLITYQSFNDRYMAELSEVARPIPSGNGNGELSVPAERPSKTHPAILLRALMQDDRGS